MIFSLFLSCIIILYTNTRKKVAKYYYSSTVLYIRYRMGSIYCNGSVKFEFNDKKLFYAKNDSDSVSANILVNIGYDGIAINLGNSLSKTLYFKILLRV